jgi:glycosyltransferase involved in cell wall biosynthesis
MRILLTAHQFLPDYFSGTEILTYSVAKELIARGHEVTVFTGYPAKVALPDNERFDHYRHEDIEVYRFHHSYVPMGDQHTVSELEYCNLLVASYFKGLLSHLKPDVIHYFHLSRLSAAVIDVGVAANVPSFFTPTDFWTLCPTSQLLLGNGKMCGGPGPFGGNCVKHVAELTRGEPVRSAMKLIPAVAMEMAARIVGHANFISHPLRAETVALSKRKAFLIARLNALDKIVAPTILMRDALLSNGVSPDKLVHSAYGIDTSSYVKNVRTKTPSEPLRIGFIGTLSEHKGCHVLIEAFNQMSAGSCTLDIYGSPQSFPDYYARLTKLASHNPAIKFRGTFPNEKISDVLDGIDVMVVPSLWYENTPLVIYSAMASGCPAIVSDFPGMTEAVHHEVNGLSFPSGDIRMLRECLQRLIETPELLKELSRNCRPPKSVIGYTTELIELFESAISDPSLVRQPPRPRLTIEDFSTHETMSVTGWVLPVHSSLQSVSITNRGTLIKETSKLGPRPDVIEAYRTQGILSKSRQISFSLTFDIEISESTLINISTVSGEVFTAPVSSLREGAVVLLNDELYLGIDRLQLPEQQVASSINPSYVK